MRHKAAPKKSCIYKNMLIISISIHAVQIDAWETLLTKCYKSSTRWALFYINLLHKLYPLFFQINFFYFQFSISQLTWQICQNNNNIVSNKPNRIMLCMGVKKILLSLRLELMAKGMVQHTDDLSRVWYHSGIQQFYRFFEKIKNKLKRGCQGWSIFKAGSVLHRPLVLLTH